MLHTKFQTSGPSGSEEEDFLIYFYVRTKDPLARGHLGPWGLHLNKIGKGPLGNLHIEFQASKPCGSEEGF